jgi:predicted peptidase
MHIFKTKNEQNWGLLSRTVNVNGSSYSYQIYIPNKLKDKTNLPIMLFLHGIGQRGSSGFLSVKGLMGPVIKSYLDRVPAIMVLPQCRQDCYWSNPQMEQMVIKSLDQTIEQFNADKTRVYLIGVSMGGYGAWHLAAEYPHKFAAVVPICGGSPLKDKDRHLLIARKIGKTPIWAFHGTEDRVVPVSESREMINAIKSVGGSIRYSEYEGVGHNVWLNVIREPELMPWLLNQHSTGKV